MATEDFSFPIIIPENHPSSVDSPPLWHLSPAASPNHNSNSYAQEEEAKANKGSCKQSRKSCSNIETVDISKLVKKKHYNSEDEEEDKMDILWEDFNEDLYSTKTKRIHSSSSPAGDMVNLGCGRALKLSSRNGNGAIFSARKPGIVVFIKVLKKIFLLHHNSPHHRSVKNNRAL